MRDGEEREVASEIKRGFVWLGAASAAARIIDSVSTLAVLWFVTREEMGLATLAWSVSVFLESFNGLGMATALVQTPKLDDELLSSAFWYTLGVAVVLVSGVCAAAPWLAAFWGAPALTPLIRLSTLKLLLVGGALVPLQILNRAMRFERIAAVNTFATLCSALSTTFLAWRGYGAWALVIGQTLHGVAMIVAAYIAQPYWPASRFSGQRVRPLAVFGARVAASGVLYHLYRNADYFFIGRYLGVAAVGLYRVGFDLAMTPTLTVLNVVNRAALPGYARLQTDRDALARAFGWTMRSLGLMLVPVTALLAFCARDVLALVNHGQWIDAAEVTSWLACAALLRAISHLFPQLFHASGLPMLAVYDSLLSMILLSLLFAVGLQWLGPTHGVLVAGWAWAIAAPLLLWVLIVFARKIIVLRAIDLWRSLAAPLGGLTVMGVVGFAALALLPPSMSPALALGIRVSLLLGAYTAYLRFALHTRFSDLKTLKAPAASPP